MPDPCTITGTILQILTQANPIPNTSSQRRGSLSHTPSWQTISPSRIFPWTDFTHLNILSSLSDFLANPHLVLTAPTATSLPTSQTLVEDEDDVDALVDRWIRVLVRPPLKLCAPVVQSRVVTSGMGMGTRDVSFKRKGLVLRSECGRVLRPDWHVYLHPYEQEQRGGGEKGEKKEEGEEGGNKTVLVVGESKCSSKWQSSRQQTKMSITTWLLPWRQLLTYCIAANTRYGFIITPLELVVVRISTSSTSSTSSNPSPSPSPTNPSTHYQIEHKSIPWLDHGTTNLTVSLSLLALSLLAMNPQHREIKDWQEVQRLNVWWEYQNHNDNDDNDDDLKKTWKHHATMMPAYRVQDLPDGAVVVARPDLVMPAVEGMIVPDAPRRSTRWKGARGG